MNKINLAMGLTITVCFIFAAFHRGYNTGINDTTINVINKPVSDYFWIDNNRVHKDSTIDCSPIYNMDREIIGTWIRVTHNNSSILIECLTTDDYTYQEFRDSFVQAFKEGL